MVNGLSNNELKEFLDSKYEQYNQKKFIESDPIQVPHNYTSKEDIEISSFLTARIKSTINTIDITAMKGV